MISPLRRPSGPAGGRSNTSPSEVSNSFSPIQRPGTRTKCFELTPWPRLPGQARPCGVTATYSQVCDEWGMTKVYITAERRLAAERLLRSEVRTVGSIGRKGALAPFDPWRRYGPRTRLFSWFPHCNSAGIRRTSTQEFARPSLMSRGSAKADHSVLFIARRRLHSMPLPALPASAARFDTRLARALQRSSQ